jgi:putative spermidine/putrescine transport system permease protein
MTALQPALTPTGLPSAPDGRRTPAAVPRGGPNLWTWAGLPAAAFVVLVFFVPLGYAVVQSFTDPSPANYREAYNSVLLRRALGLTFQMATVVTILCLLVSYPFAYAMARGGRMLRGFLIAAVMTSFWTSFLVRTFSWQVLLSNSGVVNDVLHSLGFTDEPIEMLHTSFAVDVAMVHILAPLVILAVYAQLRAIPAELELAAQSMGARPTVAFWRVTFPLTLPGAFAGAVLVYVMSLGYYITPQVLGDSGRAYLGQVIVLYVERFFAFGTAAAIAVILLILVAILLGVAARLVGAQRLLGLSTADRSQR